MLTGNYWFIYKKNSA